MRGSAASSQGFTFLRSIPERTTSAVNLSATDLRPHDGRSPMALDAFIAETMKELETDGDEIAVGDAKKLFGVTSPVW
jgi:hypothetical protein